MSYESKYISISMICFFDCQFYRCESLAACLEKGGEKIFCREPPATHPRQILLVGLETPSMGRCIEE